MTGNEFKTKRKALGLTQAKLAELWNIGLRTVARIESSDKVSTEYEQALLYLQLKDEGYTDMAKTVTDKIVAMMQRKNGATKPEVVERGFNENTARRVLAENCIRTIERKCTVTKDFRAAYLA